MGESDLINSVGDDLVGHRTHCAVLRSTPFTTLRTLLASQTYIWVFWVCRLCRTLNEYNAGLSSFTNYSGILGGCGVPSWAVC